MTQVSSEISRFTNSKRKVAFIGLLFLFVVSAKAYAQNEADTVVLTNGDRIVGTIDEVTQGVLKIKPAYAKNNFEIKWEEVNHVSSLNQLLFTIRSGAKVEAFVDGVDSDAIQLDITKILIQGKKSGQPISLGKNYIPRNEIVYVEKLEDTFFDRLDGEISMGFNLTKANSLRQYALRSSIDYTTGWLAVGTTFNGINSTQQDTETIQRVDASLTLLALLRSEWFLIGRSSFLSNTEQLVDLRTDLKLGMGRFIIFQPKAKLSVQAGINFNFERFDSETPDNQSTEAVYGLNANFLDFGAFSIQGTILGYTGISEARRFRSDSKLDVKYDFFEDFFIKLGATVNYDNQPAEGATDFDYILQTTLGWSF